MATHVIAVDLWRCLGSGSCYVACRALGNNPPKIGLTKVGPFKNSQDKPRIAFLHYPTGSCIESLYCMEIFNKKGITPCTAACPERAIRIVKLEELPKLLANRKSGEGFHFQIFK